LRPAATIIVPLLQQKPEYLEQCLASVVSQTVPCQVLIVVSVKTPVGNIDIVDRFCRDHPNVEKLMRTRPTFAAAINTGIAAAAAERVALLLSDDWLTPRAVEACLGHEADIVSAGMGIYDAGGNERFAFSRLRTMTHYEKLESMHDRASYLGHFYLLRREAVLDVGGVDENIGNVGPDDLDLMWSMLELGATVSIVEEEVYGCRDHDGVRLTLRPKQEQITDLNKIFDKHGVVGNERERLSEAHARWYGRTLWDTVNADRRTGDRLAP
jgi:glycosyltransferase involved in cell wall biosynthesis